jgi:hypothetical protein
MLFSPTREERFFLTEDVSGGELNIECDVRRCRPHAGGVGKRRADFGFAGSPFKFRPPDNKPELARGETAEQWKKTKA